jgi:hypothetical protein
MNTLLLLAAVVLGQLVELSVSLAPRDFEEPCFALSRGDRVDFGFKAAAALDFNLHYHDRTNQAWFPLDLKDVEAHEGTYVAPATATYCLMWTNKQATPVDFDYHYRVYTAKEQ